MNTNKHLVLLVALVTIVAFAILSDSGTANGVSASTLEPVEASLKTCRVTSAGGSRAYVVRTESYVHLRKGTLLTFAGGRQHQGLILVRAKVGRRIESLNIDVGNTDCKS